LPSPSSKAPTYVKRTRAQEHLVVLLNQPWSGEEKAKGEKISAEERKDTRVTTHLFNARA
jgi:hypothetical protein